MSSAPIFDEMTDAETGVRTPYAGLHDWLEEQAPERLQEKRREAETIFKRLGITFAVYGDAEAVERLIPFDVIPRILSAAEWRRIAQGLEQRVRALNAFLYDIYHRQEIVRAGEACDGDRAAMAEQLEVSEQGLKRRMTALGLK